MGQWLVKEFQKGMDLKNRIRNEPILWSSVDLDAPMVVARILASTAEEPLRFPVNA